MPRAASSSASARVAERVVGGARHDRQSSRRDRRGSITRATAHGAKTSQRVPITVAGVDDLGRRAGAATASGAVAVHVGDQHLGAVARPALRASASPTWPAPWISTRHAVAGPEPSRGRPRRGWPPSTPVAVQREGSSVRTRHRGARFAHQRQVGDGGAHVHAGQVVAAGGRPRTRRSGASAPRGRITGGSARITALAPPKGSSATRVLQRHGGGQTPALGHRVGHAGVGLEAHAAQARAERGVVDHDDALQADRQVLADDLAPSLVRLVSPRAASPSPPCISSVIGVPDRGLAPSGTSASHDA